MSRGQNQTPTTTTKSKSKDHDYIEQPQSISNVKKQQWIYPNIFPKGHRKAILSRGPSLLDPLNPQSQLNKSSIKGFYRLAVIFTITFLITKPLSNFLHEGRFVDWYLFETFTDGYLFCILTWPLFFLWYEISDKVPCRSFTSFFLQKAIILGLSPKVAVMIQHLTQAGLFGFSTFVILENDWCSSHAAFVILQASAHFMKMHSYTTVNRDYREEYLSHKGEEHYEFASQYPENINIRDFVLFMFTPWLVYADYPRRQKTDYGYALQKAVHVLSLVFISYIVHTEYIMPYFLMGDRISFVELILLEMLPSTILVLFMFVLTFECFTNFFAEITKLDHREFYQDWWNSSTFEEFNRKWNQPVHSFLFRHVYQEMIVRQKSSKMAAQALTFAFSAALHEFLLAVIFRVVCPVFMGFIVFQIPLIYYTKFMQGRKSGNYLFWIGIILGPTLIIAIYLKLDNVKQKFTVHEIAPETIIVS